MANHEEIRTDGQFRINFHNGPRSLHTLAASLFSIGLPDKVGVSFSGKMLICQDNQWYQSGESKTLRVFVHGLIAEDGSGNLWAFTGRLDDGRQVQGFIKLLDGAGFVQHA
jgi:hypothetical protein